MSIDQAFDRHAASIASGFAMMSPEPPRRPFNPNHHMIEPTEPEPVTEPTESSTQQVIRESGLVGAFELKQGVISSYLACFAESVPHILFLVGFLLL